MATVLSMTHKVPSTELLVYGKHLVLVCAPFSQRFCNLWSTISFDKTNNMQSRWWCCFGAINGQVEREHGSRTGLIIRIKTVKQNSSKVVDTPLLFKYFALWVYWKNQGFDCINGKYWGLLLFSKKNCSDCNVVDVVLPVFYWIV